MAHRVVVTGIGVIHNLGEDAESFWNAIVEGKSGIKRLERFDPSEYNCQVGAEHRDFNPADYMDPKEVRRNDRFVHFAMAASKRAVEMAKVDMTQMDVSRVGVIIGSGVGGMNTIEEQVINHHDKGPRRVSPFTIPMLITNMASGTVAIELGARGPNYGVVSACASATHAMGDAYHFIARGDTDMMICGGAEAAITPVSFAGFCAMKAMATDYNDSPQQASRPFDAKRSGFVMGEGAGILILESLESAQKRGATIIAEVVGYGASCDGFHITQPDPEGRGLELCMRKAIETAGLKPEDVDYINAHGTSTAYNDKFETLAIKKVFGEHAKKLKISSTKSMTGHLLGAAGGIEGAICAMALHKGVVPPTINLENPDPDCDLDYVPNKAQKADIKVVISNNLGFGGQNACIAFKKFEG